MELGAFSISLNVADLDRSRTFYETLGFSVFAGDEEKNYFIMKSGQTLIGLFHGMFEKNILTFNPGWGQNAETLQEYTDVREIHASVRKAAIPVLSESMGETSGPGSFVVQDPDGNTILFDQHV
jgi:catechol 2,3-dioxygenase-like lactoylglutathione lyase family enzyme